MFELWAPVKIKGGSPDTFANSSLRDLPNEQDNLVVTVTTTLHELQRLSDTIFMIMEFLDLYCLQGIWVLTQIVSLRLGDQQGCLYQIQMISECCLSI